MRSKLVTRVEATEKQMAAVVDPSFLYRKGKGVFGHWFVELADAQAAAEAITKAFSNASCTIDRMPIEADEADTELELEND